MALLSCCFHHPTVAGSTVKPASKELKDIADRRDLSSPAHAVDVAAVAESNWRWWLP